MINLSEHKQLILFDGVCNLCNNSINYIIKHDKKDIFMFAPLQGQTGKEFIKKYKIDSSKTDSIILYKADKGILVKSSAAIAIASELGFPRSLMRLFYIIPAFVRNWVYDFVAKNRYKWYGKNDACMIPTSELKAKFLE